MNQHLLNAEELGIKLEIAGDLAIWEASPVYKHQKAVDRIRDSFEKSDKSDCECLDVADVYVYFPDGSLMRPDISVFCREPDEEEEAIRQVPEAIVEVISKKYEAKDLEISPPIYLANGVKDVLVLNPYTLEVSHFKNGQRLNLTSPVRVFLECGCSCEV